MKNLIYKELKLSMHITCYLFPLLFGIFMAIPHYPAFVAPLYSIVCYPILFLGANKGQSTNDLFYTCNLPIRKRDVVKARIMTVTLLHIFSIVSTAAFMPIGIAVTKSIAASGGRDRVFRTRNVQFFGVLRSNAFRLCALRLYLFAVVL